MDDTKLAAFMGQLVADMGGAAMIASVIVGEELGLYRALADGEPRSADELAAATGCHPRLVLEWLNAQAASGYVEQSDGRYRLPEEQAMALANEDSPVYVAGGAGVLAALFLEKDKQIAAMRGNGAVSWGEHHPCLFDGTERFFRPGYKANLVSTWLPALNGVTAKLHAGAQVADVGCGHGASTVLMAEAYPASRFVGYDFHGPSIEAARDRARAAGVEDSVTFTQAAATEYDGTGFDLVCFFDCLHDMGDRSAPLATPTTHSSMTAPCCWSSRSPATASRTTAALSAECSTPPPRSSAPPTRCHNPSAAHWEPKPAKHSCTTSSPRQGSPTSDEPPRHRSISSSKPASSRRTASAIVTTASPD